MGDFFDRVLGWCDSTHIQEQVANVDYVGLFTNPWFLVPFVLAVGYLLYKQSFKDLIVIAAFLAVWYVSGTDYMQTLIVDGELEISKILPVLFGGAGLLAFLIYIFFGRSD